ncbi:MAG: hypothetical protein COA60_003275 [Robiginitomaculum sp.]|nr:hypothetical protein [Robiginitomaculum sp.]
MNVQTDPGQPPKALIAAVRRILRPLVRGFIRFGITYSLLTEILKLTYVDIAAEDFRLDPDKRPSDSRISLLTRVHRKDIRKFKTQDEPDNMDLTDHSISAQIIALWLADATYQNQNGAPKPIPRSGENSFEQLARAISKDMHPRAILDELTRSGIVTITDDDQVYLDVSAFIPDQDFDNLAWYFGLNLHDHIAASTHNISGKTPAFLDQSVHYSGLSKQSVDELHDLSRELGTQSLLRINTKAQQLEVEDAKKDNFNQRMTFGVYFFGGDDE